MTRNQDFKKIDYLLEGNPRQQKAYRALKKLEILTSLKNFSPIMVGTIPIEVDIEGSDIDIICESNDLESFEAGLKNSYQNYPEFRQRRKIFQSMTSSVTSFLAEDFEFEIFAQPIQTEEQRAFRHMLIEHRILELTGPRFKQEVLTGKKNGESTEESFARILGLSGNPYDELLKLEQFDDLKILALLSERYKKVL